jgi:hypothetical protein
MAGLSYRPTIDGRTERSSEANRSILFASEWSALCRAVSASLVETLGHRDILNPIAEVTVANRKGRRWKLPLVEN